ncbi:beta-ketoacyl synthase N-terminal-like domain-containing protein, partial [Mesorhizobium sp. M0772]|uniref:beta-ketoacyl synthase N-terminal-like domain-containing protein n=1 Tax=Mesorhizobium sp. M0772 TaxID=2956998 RepID=UPI003334B1B4
MAGDLYRSEPAFRTPFDRCADIISANTGEDPRSVLFERPTNAGNSASDRATLNFRAMVGRGVAGPSTSKLNETRLAQPIVYAIGYALNELLGSFGIRPTAVIGHSLGEYVAATVAGVLSMSDALNLVCRRAALIHDQPRGAMLAVALSDNEILARLPTGLDLAVINGGQATVVAGPIEIVRDFEAELQAQDIACRMLETTHAFHSRLLEPAAPALTELVAQYTLNAPRIPLVSNLTGAWLTAADAANPSYWAKHMCGTVHFSRGLEMLLRSPDTVLVEVGAGQALASFAKQHTSTGADRIGSIFSTLPSVHIRESDLAFFQTTLGRMWLSGVDVDFTSARAGEGRRRLPLPTYPFEGERHFREAPGVAPATTGARGPNQPTDEARVADTSRWFYRPTWRAAPLPPSAVGVVPEPMVVFARPDDGMGRIAAQLTASGCHVTTVQPGAEFRVLSEDCFEIRPSESADYERLIMSLTERGHPPIRFVHGWTAFGAREMPSDETLLDLGFFSVLALGKALGGSGAPFGTTMVVLSAGISATGTGAAVNATIQGVCKALPQECAGVDCRVIETAGVADGPMSDAVVAQLAADIRAKPVARCVAYQDGKRQELAFLPLELPTPLPALRWRKRGVYLITGGIGEVALAIAKDLSQRFGARLALIGRTTLPPEGEWADWLRANQPDSSESLTIRRIEEINCLAGEAMYCCADVSDVGQLRQAIADVRSRWGDVHGVIHAAGVSHAEAYATVANLTRSQCLAHLSPKRSGLLAVHEVTKDEDLDVRIAFSSLAAVLGGMTFGAYAAANAFMDAFAAAEPDVHGARWRAVNWDTWGVRDHNHGNLGSSVAKFEMTPTEALAALDCVVSCDLPSRIVNSTGDLDARYRQWVEPQSLPPRHAAGPKTAAAGGPAHKATPRQIIVEAWRDILGIEKIGENDNFFDLGGNSLTGMQLIAKLSSELGMRISILSLFEASTVTAFTRLLFPDDERPAAPAVAKTPSVAPPDDTGPNSIAIIAMSGRFPGASSVDEYWDLVRDGREAITHFTADELIAAGVDPSDLADPAYVKARPVMNGIAEFDAGLFGYTPREAELMDPQHRLFMECAWEALENAGYDGVRYEGRVGVFGGCNISSYLMRMMMDDSVRQSLGAYQAEYQAVIGNDKDSLTTSVSYKLNLRGPSFAVQTFCSTSLVAVHLACQSLQGGECDIALAGGVSVRVPDRIGYFYREGGMESPDGHCRAFDRKARGTLFGDGVGVVALKRLRDALADRDPVLAVIRGSAVNNDGALKVGFTAPSVVGQAQVVVRALEAARLTADEIDYVEAHGTGTILGDPIEVASLTKAFQYTTDKTGYCRLGSVKPNVGHLDRAAGVASLIKVVKALEHGVLPPSINFDEPNPDIDFERSPFRVNTVLTAWRRDLSRPRRAGVNSLGMGGTNVHVVVEECPEQCEAGEVDGATGEWHLL